MVASRNQHHVIARRIGSLPNGSMPSYFGAKEISQHISKREIKAANANKTKVFEAKPKMKQYTRGRPMERKDLSTRYGWSSVSIVKDSKGRYVVEHYCPRKKGTVIDKRFNNIEDAQAYAQKITAELRDYGHSNVGFSPDNLGFIGAGNLDATLFLAVSMVYVGLDFPGARSAAKAVKQFVDEPLPKIQMGMLFLGVAGIVGRQFKVI